MKIPHSLMRAYHFIGRNFNVNPPLFTVAIEPTNDCNLNCPICHRDVEIGYMSLSLYKRIIDDLAGFPYTVHVGLNYYGESFLHPDFTEMSEYAIKNRLPVNVITNGTLLEKVKLPPELKIVLSDHHVKLSDTDLNRVDYISIVLGDNAHKPEYWLKRGKTVHVHPYVTPELTTDITWGNKQRSYCCSVFNSMAILWNGDVTTCCHDYNRSNVIANLNDYQNIKKLWHSPLYRKIRMATWRLHKPNLPLCKTCMLWKFSKYVKVLKP